MMKNIALKVEYDGVAFSGWQRQKNAVSVQQVLEEALTRALGEEIRVIGAGRTDAGVHALGMIANFRTETRIPPEKLAYVINRELPETVRIQDSFEVPIGFHARYHAAGKHYRYLVKTGPFPSALYRDRAWQMPYAVDIEKMREAASYLTGTHDFKAFCASGSDVKTTVRTLYKIQILEDNGRIIFDFWGSGFLYNMVRILVGTLIYVGQGRIDALAIPEVLKSRDRTLAGITAPPQGLYMAEVYYTKRYISFLHPVAFSRLGRCIPVKKTKKSQPTRVCHTQNRVFALKNGKIEKVGEIKNFTENEK